MNQELITEREQMPLRNVDERVVNQFGEEWTRFDQAALSGDEWKRAFDSYFGIFPWDKLPAGAKGFDAGCGSGRWARGVAARVGKLYCIDASPAALDVARRNLRDYANCEFYVASVADMPIPNDSMDFGYSLGVLHHVPDTEGALRACVARLKRGAPFLVYLYYRFDNKPWWVKVVWRLTDVVRRVVCRMPRWLRVAVTEVIALLVYWPLARTARALESRGKLPTSFPLRAYRHSSFYSMRTESLDRFGTRLEKRFTKNEIAAMLTRAGLTDIRFNDAEPFWCAVGIKS